MMMTMTWQRPRLWSWALLFLLGSGTTAAVASIAVPEHELEVMLGAVNDGSERRGPAFHALLDSSHEGSPPTTRFDEAWRDALLGDADRYRGQWFEIGGQLVQQNALTAPGNEPVVEWFIRTTDAGPVAFLLSSTPDSGSFVDGDEVVVRGRFWKWFESTSRDGQTRKYVAFVGPDGTVVEKPAVAGGRSGHGATILVLVLVAGCCFVVLRRLIRRLKHTDQRGHVRRRTHPDEEDDPPDDERPLPTDPDRALAELRRRAIGSRNESDE